MDDKNLMENILLLEKGACDLYMHGSLESGTANVHDTFSCALNDSVTIQDEIYSKMTAKGWYQVQQVQQQQVDQVKQKFTMK